MQQDTRYRQANQDLLASQLSQRRVVLIGDSILYNWPAADLPCPPGLAVINRGIPRQDSNLILRRFQDDVIALHPVGVVILAGTNDLRVHAGPPAAAGPALLAQIQRNVTAMADLVQSHGIKAVLCGLLPIGTDLARIGRDPATIVRVNDWLRSVAGQRGFAFADFHTALADATGHFRQDLSKPDGIHPSPQGYRAMWPVLRAAFAVALWPVEEPTSK
ncbi:GDSL-type esterase/lipase family protein [Acidisphaera sp. L21]|jgi:lysophospholipase L1-like esterase|uniref:GDSL-type esterase/lipase family protein n=1 Tax=Acidisphaera sp. L21 TaxID=1641851 RepID=UPI0020B10AF8|nr:GDSL-type esterase/lipase family protein [Acidisphaera sp. L21]